MTCSNLIKIGLCLIILFVILHIFFHDSLTDSDSIFSLPMKLLHYLSDLFSKICLSLSEMFIETFKNKEERVVDIHNWFNKSSDSFTYEKYKKEVSDSDILEYSTAKSLFKSGKLTPEILHENI